MPKYTVTHPVSQSESTGSNNAITAPSATAGDQNHECDSSLPAAATTNQPSRKPEQTSNKQKSQLMLSPPLPLLFNETVAIVITSLSQPPPTRPNRTAANVVPSVMPITPQPAAANVAGSGARQQHAGINYSRPHGPVRSLGVSLPGPRGRENSGVIHPTDFILSPQFEKQCYGLYMRQMDQLQQQQNKTADYLSKMEGGPSNQARSSGGTIFLPPFGSGASQPVRYPPYYSTTVDFLSQMEMEARRSAAPMQVVNPPNNEMLAEWGATLTLGNRRRQPQNFNLKLN